jgi:hypothetical protein
VNADCVTAATGRLAATFAKAEARNSCSFAQGTPIDGVSFQMHLGGGFGPAPTKNSVIQNLQRFADLGLPKGGILRRPRRTAGILTRIRSPGTGTRQGLSLTVRIPALDQT